MQKIIFNMLTVEDKKEIKKIVKDELEVSTDSMRRSLANIERNHKVLFDIWQFVKEHASQLKNHENRISSLESPKFS